MFILPKFRDFQNIDFSHRAMDNDILTVCTIPAQWRYRGCCGDFIFYVYAKIFTPMCRNDEPRHH